MTPMHTNILAALTARPMSQQEVYELLGGPDSMALDYEITMHWADLKDNGAIEYAEDSEGEWSHDADGGVRFTVAPAYVAGR